MGRLACRIRKILCPGYAQGDEDIVGFRIPSRPSRTGLLRGRRQRDVGRFNGAAYDVANFFEEVGYFHRRGVLRAESVWHTFGLAARVYWAAYGPSVLKMREEENDPTVYEDFERLDRLVADRSSERGMPPPTREQLRRIMEDETVIGQESSPATE